MNVLNHEHINQLVTHRSPHSVSLFMPTHRAGRERRQDGIRLKNLIRRARRMAAGRLESASAVGRALQSAADLRYQDDYWRYRSDGLACFCAPEFFRAYRVPVTLDEHVVVGTRFYIRPLLPLLRSDARVHILSLTTGSARLLEATKYSVREVELPEIACVDADGAEPVLQCHTHNAPTRGKGKTEAAIYHGHGGAGDKAKRDAAKFFQSVDRAVAQVLGGQRAPLVLACVGYLAALYDSANSFRHLLPGKVPGSPDRWSDDELRHHAWKIAGPFFRQRQQAAWERFQDAVGRGRTASELRHVVLAAREGRVDTLFLVPGERRYGHVDSQLRAVHEVESEAEGEELLDDAAAHTLGHGGEVFLRNSLPDSDSPAAATLRYSQAVGRSGGQES